MKSEEIENAIIESAVITTSDHGLLSVWLNLTFNGSGQGFGGYALYPSTHHSIQSPAGHFIYRCMEIAGVENWHNMPGKTIRVKRNDSYGRIAAIGHIIQDDWFYPKQEMKG
jgi:hypothetical protein